MEGSERQSVGASPLEQPDTSRETSLATIATFSYPTQAHILRTRLEAEGIETFIADELTITGNWLYSNAVGGVKLQVRESDMARAREILNQESVSAEMTDAELDDEEQQWVCPRCQSPRVHYEKYHIRLVFLSWLILHFPIPILKRKWRCTDCGHEWRHNR